MHSLLPRHADVLIDLVLLAAFALRLRWPPRSVGDTWALVAWCVLALWCVLMR